MNYITKYIFASIFIASIIGIATINSPTVMAQRDTTGMAPSQDQNMQSSDQSLQRQQQSMQMGPQDQNMPSMSSDQSSRPQALQQQQSMQSANTASSPFWVNGGNKIIYLWNSVGKDTGWMDLCAKTSFNQMRCFGTQNWQASNSGFAMATFYVPSGWYKCFDSFAQSSIDQWWSYGISHTSPYADHHTGSWQAPPINYNVAQCINDP